MLRRRKPSRYDPKGDRNSGQEGLQVSQASDLDGLSEAQLEECLEVFREAEANTEAIKWKARQGKAWPTLRESELRSGKP